MGTILRNVFSNAREGRSYNYTPPPQPVEPEPIDYAAQAAAKEAAEKKRKAASLSKGAASTILTGGMGIEEMPAVQRKQLFGQ